MRSQLIETFWDMLAASVLFQRAPLSDKSVEKVLYFGLYMAEQQSLPGK